jgi:hypothetical protein
VLGSPELGSVSCFLASDVLVKACEPVQTCLLFAQ